MSYPLHRGERRARRQMAADRIRATAEAEAKLVGLSINCRHGHHAPRGCRNTGTGCLCECHDPAVADG